MTNLRETLAKAIMLAMFGTIALSAFPYFIEEDGFYFNLAPESNYCVQVMAPPQGVKYTGEVVIPSKVYHPTEMSWYAVTRIGTGAFSDCDEMVSLSIPPTVTHVESDVFNGCTGLTKLILQDSDNAIYFAPIGSQNGLPDSPLEEAYIGRNVIAPLFAYCSCTSPFSAKPNLKNVTFSDKVTKICWNMFQGSGLESIILPPHVTQIDDMAFCGCTLLQEVQMGDEVKSIGVEVFDGCTELRHINFSAALETIECSFEGFSKLESPIIIPDGVTILSSNFSYCTSIPSIYLGKGLTVIPDYTFNGCTAVTEITGGENLEYIGYSAFQNNPITDFTFGSKLTGIGSCAFAGTKLSKLELPESLQKIGYEAFKNCQELTEAILPSQANLDYGVFTSCANLKKVILPENMTAIPSSLFDNCSSLEDVEFGNLVTIGSGAFYGCSSLKSFTCPQTLVNIENVAFNNCTSLEHVNFNNGLKTIFSRAFNGCSSLKDIEFPESLESLEDHTFAGCTSLERIEIPYSITNLAGGNRDNYGQFDGCTSLKTVAFGEGFTSIPPVFQNQSAIVEVTLPSTATELQTNCFYRCSSLSKINLPEGLVSIGNSAFAMCSELEDITIPSTLSHLGKYSFEYTKIKNLDLSKSNILFDDYALAGCKSLEKVSLPENLTEIPERLLYACPVLRDVTIGDNVKIIGKYAFLECKSLESIKCPSLLERIDEYAFSDCNALREIIFNDELTEIGSNAFKNCSALENVNFPESLSTLGESAFYGCKSLVSVAIPENVQSVPQYCFSGATSLVSLQFPSTLTSIGDGAFRTCTNIRQIKCDAVIPPTLQYYTFDSRIYPLCELIVPDGSGERYREDSIWQKFIIKENPSTAIDTVSVDMNTSRYFTLSGIEILPCNAKNGFYIKESYNREGKKISKIVFIR